MTHPAGLVAALRSADPDRDWTGPNGLFHRAANRIERLEAALEEVRDLLDGYVDVKDGANGPLPNDAMRAQQEIEATLREAT